MTSTDERRIQEGWLRVPFSVGLTSGEAVTALRDTGFTGTIALEPLAPDDAWADGPPGRVTGTDPPAGRVAPPGTAVTVYVNPGPAGPLSEEDRRVVALARARDDAELALRLESWAARRLAIEVPPGLVVPRPATDTLLTDDLLVELGRLVDPGGADTLAPGLTDAKIDDLVHPTGLDLPEEARRWWRWRNGVQEGTGPPFPSIAGRTPLSLAAAVELWEEERDAALQVWEVDGLLPPLDDRPHLFFECLGPRDAPVPVYVQHDIETPELAFASIGELAVALLSGRFP